MLSAICFNLDQSKILLSGNGLTSLNAEVDSGAECRPTLAFSIQGQMAHAALACTSGF